MINIFRKNKFQSVNINSKKLLYFDSFFKDDKYISKNDCKLIKEQLNEYSDLITIKNNNFLKRYCKRNCLDFKNVKIFINDIKNFDSLVLSHNNDFIKRHLKEDKEYLDNILKDSDSKIKLDNEQRIAILSDEDYTLIIAGAGAGKTTTVAAKVKYLVDKKDINPNEILVISFTNKAVDELRDRINKDLKIPCAITTFHSIGNAIIRKQQDKKLNVASEGFLYNTINRYLQEKVLTNPDILNKLILFFSYYLELDLDVSSLEHLKNDLSTRNLLTLKNNVEIEYERMIQQRLKSKNTINNERVRSIEEAKIANFLYINGIEYDYEKPYKYNIKGSKKVYCPDFTIYNEGNTIYLEHFGITENGENNRYTKRELELYKKHIGDKIKLHKEHNTQLLYTFSSYNDRVDFLKHLEENMKLLNIKFNPVDKIQIYKKLQQQTENKYFTKFIRLMESFISNFKTNGYDESDFSRLTNQSNSERTKIFLSIAYQIYMYYQSHLKENDLVDYQDMINDSTKILKDVKDMNQKLSFKYIFVDEYQDISLQRFDLTKELSKVTNSKIVAVGDDWQSIYSFSGAKIELFTKFKQLMGYANVISIIHTYRNSQQLIDIAGKFIQKNESQITKQLLSNKSIKYPIAIFTYNDDQNKNLKRGTIGIMEEKAIALTKVLECIIKRQKKDNSSILLLGRYNFDANHLANSSLFEFDENKNIRSCKYPNLNIKFMTAHSSKGLGFDDVVIINAQDGLYGFPSQIKNDPVLNLVVSKDRTFDYAEERRLFYVALTRTKNRVYILSPKLHPSRFVIELINNYSEQIYLDDKKISKDINNDEKRYIKCPACGYPMYLMNNKYYGRRLWICSNDPEICDFETNDLRGGKTRIRKCPACHDGYLFVMKVKDRDSFFLGCSNYKTDNTGCNYTCELDYDSLKD